MLKHLLSSILRIFFRLLYHQFAWTYDFVANLVSVGMWNDWVNSVLAELSGEKVLELGHGPGHLQKHLLAQGTKVIGIDKSPVMGRIARQRLEALQLPFRLINADGTRLPLTSNSMDQVVATFPTEYIFGIHALTEILRVLVPGGSLIILPVAWIKPYGLLKRAASLLFRITGQAGEWNDKYLDPFIQVGFDTQAVTRELSNSTVLHIIATKPKD